MIKQGDKVQVMEGALPRHIVGRVGVVDSIMYHHDGWIEAWVKFSDSHRDGYLVDITKLKKLG